MLNVILPTWDAPKNIRAYSTTRQGGFSLPPFQGLNLAHHVGDDPQIVQQNRALLQQTLSLPTPPRYLNQIHSTKVLTLPCDPNENLNADACYSNTPHQVCLVMTADCLPILICNQQGSEVAAIHAGWRGLCDGIIEETLKHFSSSPQHLMAWLAPAISQQAFQVGEEVKKAFLEKDPLSYLAFKKDPNNKEKYFADLYHLARLRLQYFGIEKISGGDDCTFNDTARFYSYRREGKTGRQATLIYFE